MGNCIKNEKAREMSLIDESTTDFVPLNGGNNNNKCARQSYILPGVKLGKFPKLSVPEQRNLGLPRTPGQEPI